MLLHTKTIVLFASLIAISTALDANDYEEFEVVKAINGDIELHVTEWYTYITGHPDDPTVQLFYSYLTQTKSLNSEEHASAIEAYDYVFTKVPWSQRLEEEADYLETATNSAGLVTDGAEYTEVFMGSYELVSAVETGFVETSLTDKLLTDSVTSFSQAVSTTPASYPAYLMDTAVHEDFQYHRDEWVAFVEVNKDSSIIPEFTSMFLYTNQLNDSQSEIYTSVYDYVFEAVPWSSRLSAEANYLYYSYDTIESTIENSAEFYSIVKADTSIYTIGNSTYNSSQPTQTTITKIESSQGFIVILTSRYWYVVGFVMILMSL
ncbi:hypothetical protein CANARDRAFT_23750 [[Candida] arabinofermentans NRRL YB-2248]|uniref:Uncharacterized protein n=1 Tax=[Candida] arabinofermentans NRRL YB-2248 TaxID=983967 RepID=A0A1E4SZ22_9ASCO|nr:hypothetical protein CANARDRAFT_23750 [[Candida] arabinofermentans NRRL YB-2248]